MIKKILLDSITNFFIVIMLLTGVAIFVVPLILWIMHNEPSLINAGILALIISIEISILKAIVDFAIGTVK